MRHVVDEGRAEASDREHEVTHLGDTRRHMADEDQERHINLQTTPEIMAGHYANFANVSHSDYEFSITFARVDHEVEEQEVPGVVVTRVNLSPRLMRELIDALEDNYGKWRTREGIKSLPEIGRSGMDTTPPSEEEPQSYTVEHDPVEGALLVMASGELDLAAAPRLATVLSMATASAEPAVVLDLAAVDFIDSTALGAIMHASTEAEAAGKRMLVVAVDGPVRRLLEITNLTGRFRVYPSRDDALAAASA